MKNRIKFLGLGVVGFATYASVALAGSAGTNETITGIGYNTTSAWLQLSAAMTGGPSCAADHLNLVFDPTTAAGKTFLSIAQSAKLSGRLVDVSGSGVCSVLAGTVKEDTLSYIKIHD